MQPDPAALEFAGRVVSNAAVADAKARVNVIPSAELASGMVEPDVIHVIIFHARRSLQTATDADDPVGSPARTIPRGAARISF